MERNDLDAAMQELRALTSKQRAETLVHGEVNNQTRWLHAQQQYIAVLSRRLHTLESNAVAHSRDIAVHDGLLELVTQQLKNADAQFDRLEEKIVSSVDATQRKTSASTWIAIIVAAFAIEADALRVTFDAVSDAWHYLFDTIPIQEAPLQHFPKFHAIPPVVKQEDYEFPITDDGYSVK